MMTNHDRPTAIDIPREIHITDRENDGWVILSVSGEVDVASAAQLRQRLVGLDEAGQRRLVLDLEGVEFLDSMGLGVLIGAYRRAAERGGVMAVVIARPAIRRVFDITGLTDVMPLYGSVEDATSRCFRKRHSVEIR